MSWLAVIGIAIGLAMDAFAVSIAASVVLPKVTPRHYFRFAFHFGLFQAGMPVLGWLAGRTVATWVAAWDHWLAFGLLAVVGGRAIFEAITGGPDMENRNVDPTRGLSLIVLSLATSIDAFAVGLGLAWLQWSIWLPVLVIGVITAALSALGMFLGQRLGSRFGARAAVAGGVVLIAIGVKILWDHLAM
ncbi:MAG: manganese efflux pump MntP family protein [bacterium]